ncbi:unnamed protein product [Heligmosomoides polygyrus]|uniref:Phlebovirus glycoprotein G2 fusion domain-containing protein n=1 Tax=Heligmosomoides polygyrus TaxID=6339 RepID=A0A3P7ZQY6_HELPZ|nr:unnamed protein product [Heligmosomoides polygyrus]
MVSADFSIEFNQTVDKSITVIDNYICTIHSTSIEGCYHCEKGALAKILCHASSRTFGEIICDKHAFVVPCSPTPESVDLNFHLDSARQFLKCTVTCGKTVNHFTLSGILKYVNNFHDTLKVLLQGNSTTYHDIKLPDISHILDVMFGWYKTILFSLLAVLFALALSYLFLQVMGFRLVQLLVRAALTLLCLPLRVAIVAVHLVRKSSSQFSSHEKTI